MSNAARTLADPRPSGKVPRAQIRPMAIDRARLRDLPIVALAFAYVLVFGVARFVGSIYR